MKRDTRAPEKPPYPAASLVDGQPDQPYGKREEAGDALREYREGERDEEPEQRTSAIAVADRPQRETGQEVEEDHRHVRDHGERMIEEERGREEDHARPASRSRAEEARPQQARRRGGTNRGERTG